MKNRVRKSVRVTAAAAVVTVALAACSSGAGSSASGSGPSGSGGSTNLSIAEPVIILAHAPLYVAIKKGYLAADHINVSFSTLDTASTIAEALTSGSIQMASGASFNVIAADTHAAHYQAVVNMGGVTLQLCASKTFVSSSGIDPGSPSVATTLAKLKGSTFGLTGFSSPPQFVLNYLLHHVAGLNPQSDAKEVSLGSVSSEQAALQRNEIQAFFQSPPTCQEASAYGTPVLTTSSLPDLRSIPYAMLYSTTSWLSAHRKVAQEVAQAIAKADDYVKANPQATATLLHQDYFPTVPVSVLEQGLTSVVIPAIPSGGTMTEAGWQSADNVMTQSGAASSTPSAAPGVMWTNSYLPGKS